MSRIVGPGNFRRAGSVCSALIRDSTPSFIKWNNKQIESWWKSRRKNKTDETITSLKNVSDYWKLVEKNQLENGSLITIQGQLSTFAPLMVGSPKKKRERHLRYRKQLQKSQIESKEKSELNAYLAYTAGQMVWRLDLRKKAFMYLGLYHSIVRNAIPVVVESKYFYSHLKDFFRNSSNPHLIEAEIKGQAVDFKEPIEGIPRNLFTGFVQPWMCGEEGSTCGIAVDGKNTYIQFVDEARYLDGDIWVTLEDNGVQSFKSRFVDLADFEDFKQEKEKLKNELEENPSFDVKKVVFQFDQMDKLFPQMGTLEDLCGCQNG